MGNLRALLFCRPQLHAIDLQAAREHVAKNNQIVAGLGQFPGAKLL